MSSANNVDIEKADPVMIEKAAPLDPELPTDPNHIVVPTGNRCRSVVLFLLEVAAVTAIALAIGLGVGLFNHQNNTTPSTSTYSNNTLELLCQENRTACQMACESAMCCFDDSDDCWISKQSCGNYAPCHVLVNDGTVTQGTNETTGVVTDENTLKEGGGATLPGAGTTTSHGETLAEPNEQVEVICNSEYMEFSNITCEEACWSANCCYWTGDESCYEDNKDVCDMWKAAGCFAFSDPFGQLPEEEGGTEVGGATLSGGTVLADGETLQEPDADVEIICSSGYLEVSDITCEQACEKASCCYWTGEDSCYEDNQDVCEMWMDAGCFAFSDPFGQDPEEEQVP